MQRRSGPTPSMGYTKWPTSIWPGFIGRIGRYPACACVRPYLMCVGRDQGLTSDISKAILAAADIPFKINFSGIVSLQFNHDAASIFIAACRVGREGALVCNLRNDVIEVADFVDLLLELAPAARITYEPNSPLPFPLDLDDAAIKKLLGEVPHTPLREAVSDSLRDYAELVAKGEIDLNQLN